MISPDDLVKINLEVFLYEEEQHGETYVTIRVTLLTDIKHCYASSVRCSILTGNKETKEKINSAFYWSTNAVPWLSSFSISRNVSDSMLDSGNLNILSELFCVRASELKSTQSEFSSSKSLVEITYVWNICNVVHFLSISEINIFSDLFPSNSDLVRFTLTLEPQNMYKGLAGYVRLFNCFINDYLTRLPLIINQTYTVRDFSNGAEAKLYGPYSQLYWYTSESNNSRCSGVYINYKQLNGQCFTFYYHGVYAIDMRPQ